ncbi:MAG: TraY domain-containing protein [Deltaproteobacteria bacterium]|nr:TraY domain-containing protein [Deltaproteobacteria bacterium]
MNLQIRDIDSSTYRDLVQRARENHRSLSAEAAVRLQATLHGDVANSRARRRQVLAQAEVLGLQWPADLPEPEAVLAEDRSR